MIRPPYIDEATEEGRFKNPYIIEKSARKTIVDRGIVVVVTYGDVDDRFGKLVTARTTTVTGHAVEENFDPALPEIGLPPLPRTAMTMSARKMRKKHRDPNDPRSRVMRLAKRKTAAE